jgi:hypothetical protein
MNLTTRRRRRFSPAIVILSVLALVPSLSFGQQGVMPPKVPFGNAPCKSLSEDEQKELEQKALGYARPVAGKADRAPATLSFDNMCSCSGNVNVGYMTQADYNTNKDGNRSSSRTAPSDLPGAFYDKQGGLWFAKDGYYVVVSGSHKLVEQAARVIAAKV